MTEGYGGLLYRRDQVLMKLNKLPSMTSTPFAEEKEEDSSGETFSLDFDL
ncbi:hypothetical protein PQG02_33565 (plasmid) [Nostoc sp. UHCC 0926]|nr:hypothetical protein [Nostoc sp. UHCC 0926]WDD36781.1 hypothetical protein PQG02_33565 [Nostoc sp. UHCC 0926]